MKNLPVALFAFLLAAVAAGGGYYWWLQQRSDLPDGFSGSNGRIEAERIDIAVKFAGWIAEVLVTEGQMVATGDVIARIDSIQLEAQVRAAEAATRQARQELAQAEALVAQREGELTFAKAELNRTETISARG